MRAKVYLVVLTTLISCMAKGADIKPLKIGDKVPAAVLKMLVKKSTVKLIILDFWSTYCSSCIDAFPKMEKLQQQFTDELTIALVNSRETSDMISKRINKISQAMVRNNMPPLHLPSVDLIINEAKTLDNLFPHKYEPHHVWISNKGIVLAITFSRYAISENIKAALAGKMNKMAEKDDSIGEEILDKSFLQPAIATIPPFYYTAIIPYYPANRSYSKISDTAAGIFRITEYNQSLVNFIKDAYDNPDRILLEVKNKEMISQPADVNLSDAWDKKYRFTYEMQGPIKDINNLKQIKSQKQQDANRVFGSLFSIEANMQLRKFDCWILVKNKVGGQAISTRKTKTSLVVNDSLYSITNYPFESFIKYLRDLSKLENLIEKFAFVDETGTNKETKVDYTLTGNLSDIENLKRQLIPYGFDIIKGQREISVLVISDKSKPN